MQKCIFFYTYDVPELHVVILYKKSYSRTLEEHCREGDMGLVTTPPTPMEDGHHRIDFVLYRPTREEPKRMVKAWIIVKFDNLDNIHGMVVEGCTISMQIYRSGEELRFLSTGRGDYPFQICA